MQNEMTTTQDHIGTILAFKEDKLSDRNLPLEAIRSLSKLSASSFRTALEASGLPSFKGWSKKKLLQAGEAYIERLALTAQQTSLI